MREHGSILLYVHENHKASREVPLLWSVQYTFRALYLLVNQFKEANCLTLSRRKLTAARRRRPVAVHAYRVQNEWVFPATSLSLCLFYWK